MASICFVTVGPKFVIKESPKHLKWDEKKRATITVHIVANPEPVVEWDIDGKTYYEGDTHEEYTSTHVVSEVCMSDNPCSHITVVRPLLV